MELQQLIDLLKDHQTEVRRLLRDTVGSLDVSEPARIKALALIRWQLMRQLRSYQLFKHRELFDPALRGNDAEKAQMASGMKERCIATAENYLDHVKKWSARCVGSDFAEYKTDARATVIRLERHLVCELAECTHLLGLAPPTRSAPITRDAQ